MVDEKKKEIPFGGKWMTCDPATIGMNFQTLKNMRYTDTHVRSVKGMTKINTSVMNATYLKTRSAHHLNKSQPAESHVLAQAYNTGLTASQVLDNTTAIPSAGDFSATALWTDSAGAGLGRFCDAPDGQVIYANGVDTCIWGGAESKCGSVITTTVALSALADTLTLPIDQTEQANNTKTDSLNVIALTSARSTFLVGSPTPLQGVKIYVSVSATVSATLTVKESTAGAWTALVATDNTAVSGVPFAQTGTITWPSTVATTKPRYFEGYYLYWYQFTVSAGTSTIYHITVDSPFQDLIDIWDGTYSEVVKCYDFALSPADKTVNITAEDYAAGATTTYLDLSTLTSAQYFEVGFTEKQTALYMVIPSAGGNTNASVMSVSYWDGSQYTSVGTIVDGTDTAGGTLNKSGVVCWVNANVGLERKKQYANTVPLYYYKISWTNTLDAAVYIDYIAGIAASKVMEGYKFPVFAQGRILLCADLAGDKNKARCSSKFMPHVYNGADSVDVYFGDDGELTCGTELFSQYGSSLYSLILMFKDTETWILAGQDIDQWESNTFLLSSSIGCPAPLTLKTINLRAEPGAGVNRALAIWQGANGVYMSDGRAPIPIHGDIKEFFDPESSLYITAALIGESTAFMDHVNQEYHLLFASGTEVAYDIARNKWFEVERGADLKCGVDVCDTNGNSYSYGFLDTGYMERLENGTTFDGTAITQTVQFGDMPLGGLDVETRISDVSLYAVAKTNDVDCTHYGDTSSSGTVHTMAHTSSNRLAMPDFDDKLNGYFHSLKFSTTGAFEPIAAVAWFHPL